MALEYSAGFSWRGGYSIGQEAIAALWNEVCSHVGGGSAGYSVVVRDGHELSGKEMTELFQDAFLRANPIERITISGTRYDANPIRRISIALHGRPDYNAIGVVLVGDRQECFTRRSEIENIVKTSALWYRGAVYGKLPWLTLGMSILLGAMAMHICERAGLTTLPGFAVTFIAVMCWFFGWDYFQQYLFPQLIFDFGKSSDQGRRATFLRNVFGIGILLSLIVSVAAGLIVELIIKGSSQ